MPLLVHASNDLDILGDRLVARLQADATALGPERIFDQQLVLVPTVGLRDWLRQRVATRLGICAGLRFCYPDGLVAVLAERAGLPPPMADWAGLARWYCLQQLPAIETLNHYLGNDGARNARAYHLARALADCFDRYAHYRPEWLRDWAAGRPGPEEPEATWQADCWRRLLAAGCPDPVAEQERLLATAGGTWPDRLYAIGFNNWSPRLTQVLAACGRVGEVQVYSLQPTWGEWGDQRSRRRRLRDAAGDDEDHRLLGDWGGIGQEFLHAIDAADGHYLSEPADFRQPGTDSLLHRLQQDITDAQPVQQRGSHQLDPADQSLQCHACHNLRRQLEVVKETIHRALVDLPDLAPHDIAVMTPDPEACAPLARALLGGDGFGPPLPVAVADRPGLEPAGEVALHLLELLSGRFTASAVRDFLGLDAVAGVWGFGSDELAVIQEWIDQADLRWGVDAEHRRAVSGHAFTAGSWRRGLQRLQLGWWYGEDGADAQPYTSASDDPADAIMPVVGLTPDRFEVLKRLSLLLETLLESAAAFRQGQAPRWWSQELQRLTSHVLRCERDDLELAQVVTDLSAWVAELPEPLDKKPVTADLVAAHLHDRWSRPPGGDFARGAITVCGLQPMRSIPFRLLCLVGLDDGVFPRLGRALDFDLTTHEPRTGDRDLRREDRYLLLELLLAARDRLCLTYTGSDPRDNSVLPPAGIVGELLDVAAATCDGQGMAQVRQEHRLHRSLEAPAWPSLAVAAEGGQLRAPVTQPLPPPPPTLAAPPLKALALDDLIAFWRQPSRRYVQQLGLRLPHFDADPRDHERFQVSAGLDRYQAAMRLLTDAAPMAELQHRLAADGWLPPGALGQHAWSRLVDFVGQLRSRRQALLQACHPVATQIDLPLVHASRGVVVVHPGRLNANNFLQTWYRVLSAHRAGVAAGGVLLFIVKDQVHEVDFRATDATCFDDLLAGYDEGHRQPLPFAPELSLTYATLRWQRDHLHERARQQALDSAWRVQNFAPGPAAAEDPAHRLLYDAEDGPSRSSDFISWAERICRPALRASDCDPIGGGR